MANKIFDDNKLNLTGHSAIKQEIIELAKLYFPELYRELQNPYEPVSYFVDALVYATDVLSYQTSYIVSETSIDTATGDRLIRLAHQLGYNPLLSRYAQAVIDIYQIVPTQIDVNTGQEIPDLTYTLDIKEIQIASKDDPTITFFNVEPFSMKQYDEIAMITPQAFIDPTLTLELNSNVVSTVFLIKKRQIFISGQKKTIFKFIPDDSLENTIVIEDDTFSKLLEVKTNDGYIWSVKSFTEEVTRHNKITLNPYNKEKVYQSSNPVRTVQVKTFLDKVELVFDPMELGQGRIWEITYLSSLGERENVPPNTLTEIVDAVYYDKILESSLDMDFYEKVKETLKVNNESFAFEGRGKEDLESVRKNALSFFYKKKGIFNSKDIERFVLEEGLCRFAKVIKHYGSLFLFVLSERKTSNDLYYLNRLGEEEIKTIKTKLVDKIHISDDLTVLNGDIVNISFHIQLRRKRNYVSNPAGLITKIVELLYQHHLNNRGFDNVIDLIDYESYLEGQLKESVEDIVNIDCYLRPEYPPHTIYEVNKYGNVIYPSIDPMIFQIYNPSSDIKISVLEKR